MNSIVKQIYRNICAGVLIYMEHSKRSGFTRIYAGPEFLGIMINTQIRSVNQLNPNDGC